MGKVVYWMTVSLDGFVETRDGDRIQLVRAPASDGLEQDPGSPTRAPRLPDPASSSCKPQS